MGIDPSQTTPHQGVGLDEDEHFFAVHHGRLREVAAPADPPFQRDENPPAFPK